MLSQHNIPGSRTSSTSMTRSEVYERTIRNKEITGAPGLYGLTRQHKNPALTSEKELYVGYISMTAVFIGLDVLKTTGWRFHHARLMSHTQVKRL